MIICHTCQVATNGAEGLTIDELASLTGTTTRRIRSFQTLGLLPHPELRGRTGLYGAEHHTRLAAILLLQERGFSLESLAVLFRALRAGQSLAEVLGVTQPAASGDPDADTTTDTAELYPFAGLQPAAALPRRGRGLLSVVPTTVWDESAAS